MGFLEDFLAIQRRNFRDPRQWRGLAEMLTTFGLVWAITGPSLGAALTVTCFVFIAGVLTELAAELWQRRKASR